MLTLHHVRATHTTPQKTLFIFCAANELFFVALYVLNSYSVPLLSSLPAPLAPHLVRLPAPLLRLLLKVSWPHLVAVLCAPVCAGKQVINGVQFVKAAKLLARSDQEERFAAREKRA